MFIDEDHTDTRAGVYSRIYSANSKAYEILWIQVNQTATGMSIREASMIYDLVYKVLKAMNTLGTELDRIEKNRA